MTNETWINLPVADIARTAAFFEAIGFRKKMTSPDGRLVCFEIGEKKFTVVFAVREQFEEFARCGFADTRETAEVLISFDAASRDDVDETARRVFDAGGTVFAPPGEVQGWMYGFGFCDPDAHRWNMVHMDWSKVPQPPTCD